MRKNKWCTTEHFKMGKDIRLNLVIVLITPKKVLSLQHTTFWLV